MQGGPVVNPPRGSTDPQPLGLLEQGGSLPLCDSSVKKNESDLCVLKRKDIFDTLSQK